MENLTQTNESFEIADLEYDVAGAGTLDVSGSYKPEARVMFCYRAPAVSC